MIVWTGGATLEDVDRAFEAVIADQRDDLPPAVHGRLPGGGRGAEPRRHHDLRERYPDVVVGLSDHQDGIAMATVAYMLGARVIEKHFTLSHASKGTDHAFSLMPEGMRKLVRDLRASPSRSATASSGRCRARRSRSRRWGRSSSPPGRSPPGTCSRAGDLVAKSPADGGLPPYELDDAHRPPARPRARRGGGDPRRGRRPHGRRAPC